MSATTSGPIDFNSAAPAKKTRTRTKRKGPGIKEVSAMMADNALAFCREFLAGGTIEGTTYWCGDMDGGAGHSFKVELEGAYTGRWYNWATDEHGDLIEFFKVANNSTAADAFAEAKKWLGITDGNVSIKPRKTPEQRQAELEEAQRQAIEQHRQKAEQAASEYKAAKPCTEHEYLTKKRVAACTGLRINAKGDIIVPLTDLDTSKLTAVQYILKTPKPNGRNKDFIEGSQVGGSSFLIAGNVTDAESQPLCLCEGLATGLTVHEVTGFDVMMCVSAGNMDDVAVKARRMWPDRPFIFAADNDAYNKKTGDIRSEDKNTGIVAARKAAKAVGGTVVIPPVVNGHSTDWNDFASDWKSRCQDESQYADFKTEMAKFITAKTEEYVPTAAGDSLTIREDIPNPDAPDQFGLTPSMTEEEKWEKLQGIDDTMLETTPDLYDLKYNIRKFCSVKRFVGKPVEEQKFVVHNLIPCGEAFLFASDGGLGKGMSILDLGDMVATPKGDKDKLWLGHRVEAHDRPVFYLTAEDSEDNVNRRLDSLGSSYPESLYVMCLPDVPSVTGAYFRKKKDCEEFEATPLLHSFWRQLKEIHPALVVVDPLRCVTTIDTDRDNVGAAFIMKTFSKMAKDLDAAIIVCHHVRKPSDGKGTNEVDAKYSISGASALVNEVRGALVMWRPSGSQEGRCKTLGLEYPKDKKRILHAMLVKANFFPADEQLLVLVRRPSGRLEDVTDDLKEAVATDKESMKSEILIAIKNGAKDNITFARTGNNSIFAQKKSYTCLETLSNATRKALDDAIDELFDEKKLSIEHDAKNKSKTYMVVTDEVNDDAPQNTSAGGIPVEI